LLERVAWVVNLAGIAISVGWFVALLIPHLKVVMQPGPQEYNEPAVWRVTWLLDHGRNPYTAAEMPASAYCFDPFYNYVVRALKPVLGADYTAHRLFNLFLLLGSLWLLVRVMRRAGAGLGIALLSAVFYYWMCLGNIMITARPDLLGLFFFLLGLFVPWERNYSRGSVIVGLVFAVLAFHCKFYFALAGCATLLGMFLLRSKREACWLGVGYFAALGLSFALCMWLFPYYYIETVVVQRGSAVLNSSDAISLMHTRLFLDRGWLFLLIMGVGAGLWVLRRERTKRLGGSVVPFSALDARIGVLSLILLIFLGLVYFYMGRNAGAYFTYHLHLLFPLMFVLAAYAVSRTWLRAVFGLLLAVFVSTRMEIPRVLDTTAPYRHLEQLIMSCPGEVLGIAATTDIFDRTGRPVLHDGNTIYMGFAFADGAALANPLIGKIRENYQALEEQVVRKVTARQYALVFTEFDQPYFCTTELLKANYDKVEQIDYFTFFGHSPVRVWRPKPR
jgi:hypothetical protein